MGVSVMGVGVCGRYGWVEGKVEGLRVLGGRRLWLRGEVVGD